MNRYLLTLPSIEVELVVKVADLVAVGSTTTRCKIALPANFVSQSKEQWSCVTYHQHELPNCSFYVEAFNSLDSDHAALRSKSWELDECSVCLHDLTNLVHSSQENAVDLSGGHMSIFHEEPRHSNKFVDSAFGCGYVFCSVTSNKDLFGVSSLSTLWTVFVNLGEGGWEIDSCVSRRFDHLDVLSGSSTNHSVERQLERCYISYTAKLNQKCQCAVSP